MTLEDENYTINMEPLHSLLIIMFVAILLVLVVLMCISICIHKFYILLLINFAVFCRVHIDTAHTLH